MVQGKEKPIAILTKRAEIQKNRIIIPKRFIDKHGRYYYMEVYKDKIILKPQLQKELV